MRAGAGGTPVVPGEQFGYVITVANNGPSHATGVLVSDVLPGMLSFVSSEDGRTAEGQTVRCGPVGAAGDSVSWVITVRTDPACTGDGSDVRDTATAGADNTDPVTADNTGQAAGPPGGVRGAEADLDLTKTARAA